MIRIGLLLFSLLYFIPSGSTQHWMIVEREAMPEKVSNNAVVEGEVNGLPYVYSFAGIDSTKIYSGIHLRSYRYNTEQDEWETIPALPDTLGKIATAASRVGEIIYIIGGYHVFANGSEISSNRVHRYDMENNSYLPDGSPIPVPIDDQVQAVWRDSLIYVVTGWSNNANVTNVQIYNPATDEWMVGTPVPGGAVYPSFGASGVILGDTIYYYGGARNGNFNFQRELRKGTINPDNPTEITWSASVPASNLTAYRAAATTVFDEVYWLGGAFNTYNYDGIAYNNGQGVEPSNLSLLLRPGDGSIEADYGNNLPMDLRGVANISETEKYLAGGMLSGQNVTNKVWQLRWDGDPVPVIDISSPDFSFQLYPNPAGEYVALNWNSVPYPIKVAIRDSKAEVIKELKVQNPPLNLYIGDLPAGTYYISFIGKGSDATQMFIKQ